MLTADRIRDEIDRYRRRLDELYIEVRRWVAGRYPNARFTRTGVDLSEEVTGPYEAESMEVILPGLPAIRLVPRGIFMVGARGRVDARSRLGREVLVWLETGGPENRMQEGPGNDVEHVISRTLFPNIVEGWAWSDSRRNEVFHLDEPAFWNRVAGPLTQ